MPLDKDVAIIQIKLGNINRAKGFFLWKGVKPMLQVI